jgi:hypothetical protein
MGVHVRCPAILARLQWVVEYHGEGAFDATLASMKPEDAAAVRAAVDPSHWVPFEAFVGLCEAIDQRYGKGDLTLCRELGRYSARQNLPTLYRIFYRLGSVPFIMSRATAVWSEHYDSGRAYAREVGPKEVEIVIEGFAMPHATHCLSVLGWVESSVSISGARVISGEEAACRRSGGEACVMRVRYE